MNPHPSHRGGNLIDDGDDGGRDNVESSRRIMIVVPPARKGSPSMNKFVFG
jgi:hypothetical protein